MNATHTVEEIGTLAPTETHHQSPASSTKHKIAYLVSEYPALSHTFIKKEIEAVERAGHSVEIVSVRESNNLEILGEEGLKDATRTRYLLKGILRDFLPALFHLIRRRANFRCMAGTWARVFLKSPLSLATYAYPVEAIVLVDWMLRHDLKHVHNHFGNAAATVAMIGAASHLVEYSLSIHGPDIFQEADSELLPMKLRGSRFSRCISYYSRSQLYLHTESKHWPRFDIVRCGIDPEQFTVRPDPQNQIPNVLCIGRLVSAKGQQILVEASKMLWDEGISHEVTFVGTGPDMEALQESSKRLGLEENVHFLGGMSPAKIKEEYARADVFVLPSFAEGIPVVLMEAMASGVPVVSTRITGIPELIDSEKNGLLVPPSDPKAIADAIRSLLSDAAFSKRLAAEGTITVKEHYHLEKNGPAMASLFEKHLA